VNHSPIPQQAAESSFRRGTVACHLRDRESARGLFAVSKGDAIRPAWWTEVPEKIWLGAPKIAFSVRGVQTSSETDRSETGESHS